MINRLIKKYKTIKYKNLLKKTKNIKIYNNVVFEKNKVECNNVINYGTSIINSYIGKGTYIGQRCSIRNCKIGRYCSIGNDVKIIYGSHPTNTFVSTHPAFYSPNNQSNITFVKENLYNEFKFIDNTDYLVKIGNDVWIGQDALIMQGVIIGDGAIIGAGSIVTKNIEPYSINVGVPAKLIKMRFNSDEIKILLDLKWWNREDTWLKDNIDKFRDIKCFTSLAKEE
ncbi:CatB-related O-acetyltransferase [Clostridium perfringens]|uniref:CatB-related O-acetyltransferase n=1 Tax=Clostridium perfringens TaxID=1502 RepID=UPI00290EA87C|nr:CatB-related O-acetyltransferase [Clostridium perfringens]